MLTQTYQKVFWIKDLSFDENILLSILNSKINFKKSHGKSNSIYLDVNELSQLLGKSMDSIYYVLNALRNKNIISSTTKMNAKGITYKEHSIIDDTIFTGKPYNNIPVNTSVSVSLSVLALLSEISTRSFLAADKESILFTAKDAEERFGIKKATYQRYINTLIKEDYITKVETYTYSLTEKAKLLFDFQKDSTNIKEDATDSQNKNNHFINQTHKSLVLKEDATQTESVKEKATAMVSVSVKIEHLLVETKMTQQELAQKMDIAPSTLSSKMTKDRWSQKDIEKVCKALDCTYDPVFTLNKSGKKF